MATLKEMFIEQLTDAYDAEKQIIEALPKLTRVANDAELELDDVAELLDENLDEETSADEKLTSIAEGGVVEAGINEEATAGR